MIGRERLVIRVARNFSPEALSQITFEPGEGFVGRAMAAGELITVEDAETDLRTCPERPEVVEAVLGEGIRSFMHIPIRLDGEVFGVFTVCYDEIRAFGAREQRLFTALAQRAALAVQKAQHFAAEQRRAEQFRVISERSGAGLDPRHRLAAQRNRAADSPGLRIRPRRCGAYRGRRSGRSSGSAGMIPPSSPEVWGGPVRLAARGEG